MSKATYKDAGVDLEVYAEAMARLPRLMHRTFSPRTIKLDGGFAGLFRLDFDSPLFARRYEEPVLVACTDGVGTKLKVAQRCGRHDTVGIDLVAMCVNDAICCGAEPLFFLDYVAMSHDDPPLSGTDCPRDQRRVHRRGLRPAGRRDGDHARSLPGRRLRLGGLSA
jgi:phosphoribosylformylglycinamidine cyclo-ligase